MFGTHGMIKLCRTLAKCDLNCTRRPCSNIDMINECNYEPNGNMFGTYGKTIRLCRTLAKCDSNCTTRPCSIINLMGICLVCTARKDCVVQLV